MLTRPNQSTSPSQSPTERYRVQTSVHTVRQVAQANNNLPCLSFKSAALSSFWERHGAGLSHVLHWDGTDFALPRGTHACISALSPSLCPCLTPALSRCPRRRPALSGAEGSPRAPTRSDAPGSRPGRPSAPLRRQAPLPPGGLCPGPEEGVRSGGAAGGPGPASARAGRWCPSVRSSEGREGRPRGEAAAARGAESGEAAARSRWRRSPRAPAPSSSRVPAGAEAAAGKVTREDGDRGDEAGALPAPEVRAGGRGRRAAPPAGSDTREGTAVRERAAAAGLSPRVGAGPDPAGRSPPRSAPLRVRLFPAAPRSASCGIARQQGAIVENARCLSKVWKVGVPTVLCSVIIVAWIIAYLVFF